jgi:hypothetical protein
VLIWGKHGKEIEKELNKWNLITEEYRLKLNVEKMVKYGDFKEPTHNRRSEQCTVLTCYVK